MARTIPGVCVSTTSATPKTTLVSTLGIEIIEQSRDRVVATMPVGPTVHQPFGILHGGASVALAETVASMAGWLNVDTSKDTVVGLEINANHLRAKRDGIVTAVATPLHIGRKTQVWEIRITDEQDKLVCISRCTLAVIPLS
jgi:1,4-dihydroxy-2-naphthoyl-CoA hydrolase